MRPLLLWIALSALLGVGTVLAEEGARPAYPATRTVDAADLLHGDRVPDPYRWLEPDADPEVEAWDRAQQALTRATLDAAPQREALRARFEAELDLQGAPTLPTFFGGRAWFLERGAGKNHAVLYARDLRDDAAPRPVLDPNAWSADGTEGLSGWWPSPDGRWLLYGRDRKGSENKTLFLRDLADGADTGLRIPRAKFASVAWAPDASGFWYTRLPDPDSVPAGEEQLHRRVFFHPLGGLVADDERVYGTGRPPLESMFVHPTSNGETVLLYRGEPYRTTELFEVRRVASEAGGASVLSPLFLGVPALSFADRVGDRWLVLTNWDAPNKRVLSVVAPTGAPPPPPAGWTEWLPEGKGVIESLDVVGDRVVVHVREDVVSSLRVFRADGTADGEVTLPGPGSVRGLSTRPGDPRLWFGFESNALPHTTFVVDVSSPSRALRALASAPTTVDVAALVAERRVAVSRDGTKIPLFVLRRRDVPLDGRAPTVLSGYGGFRVGQPPTWSSLRALWAEMGGVHVTACLRGGDEYGDAWHAAGSLGNKQNVYDDFIAAADTLVTQGLASRDRLAIAGGSNGGLLVAAVTNQRPDLCRAVLCSVPLTDMLRYHRFQYAKIWTKEYGDPDVEAEYRWIRPYSPVHNVRPAPYPACLVTAGLHDGRVNAFHARKIAALWQSATTSTRPILLSIDRDSGHGAASRKQLKEDQVDRYAFLLAQLGTDGITIRVPKDARPAVGPKASPADLPR